MRKSVLLIAVWIMSLSLAAQKQINIHTDSGIESHLIEEDDYAGFNEDQSLFQLFLVTGNYDYSVSEIDSITFTLMEEHIITINYNGDNVSVTNPLAGNGIEIEVTNADVIVTSTIDEKYITYKLTGSTSDGTFKIYSDNHYNLVLDGLEIINPDGPALNLQSGKNVNIILEPGTINTLTDGAVYADPPGEEDQDGTLFCEGDIEFLGSGDLVINSFGDDQHGIYSKDGIEIKEGTITVTSATKDGVHGKDGVEISGGILSVTSSGDGIDAKNGVMEVKGGETTIYSIMDDVKAMKTDSIVNISGGTIDIILEGNQSKGIDADQDIFIQGCEINITATGGVVLEASGSGYDPSYCSAISANGNITFSNCIIDISSSGEAGRGVACDGNISIAENSFMTIEASGDGAKYTNEDGEDDAYHGSCLNADGDLLVSGGVINVSNSGDGGKGITVDGHIDIPDGDITPELNVTTTGDPITITQGGGWGNPGEYDESKAVKADNRVTINNGILNIDSADDGIKSDSAIIINNGTIHIVESVEGLEAPEILIHGGEIHVTASDDATNATYGTGGEWPDGSLLSMTGGYLVLSATGGDAIDSNGDFEISGGTMIVHGPQSSPEVAMDVNGDKLVSGGFIIASGTNSSMTENFSNGSTQYSVLFRSNSSQSANTIFHIEDAEGNDIITFAPERRYYSMLFTSDEITNGITYSLYTGGTSTGNNVDGVYIDGTYSGGTLKTTFTLNGMINTVWY